MQTPQHFETGQNSACSNRRAQPSSCTMPTPRRAAALEVSIRQDFERWAALSEGAYVLRSNVTEWSDQQLWRAYIQLTQAEAAFRIQKDQLSIRPIWHQREDRVQAHILVCFLAFVLWKTLELWQERAGLGNSPRTLLKELVRISAIVTERFG
jgi:transposase